MCLLPPCHNLLSLNMHSPLPSFQLPHTLLTLTYPTLRAVRGRAHFPHSTGARALREQHTILPPLSHYMPRGVSIQLETQYEERRC